MRHYSNNVYLSYKILFLNSPVFVFKNKAYSPLMSEHYNKCVISPIYICMYVVDIFWNTSFDFFERKLAEMRVSEVFRKNKKRGCYHPR